MKKFLHDLFFPHEHNNFRARLLHHRTLFISITLVLFAGFFISTARTNFPKVLGVSYDITSSQLLYLTNLKRQENGLSTLGLNDKLNLAAANKAKDMFSHNYWAHNSPVGLTPWVFIKDSGYTYVYAGENLARGFSTSDDVVKAWMASPDHRENMLSKNYSDVGFTVAKGKLLGEETVLIIEMLGSTSFTQENAKVATIPPVSTEQSMVLSKKESSSIISSVNLSKNLALIITVIFITVLFLDAIVIERRKVTRFVGHNLDHIFFFIAILSIIFIIARGLIA